MNLKNLNRSTKSNIITFGIVIGFYLLIQILSAAGMVTNSFAGQLVPICAYVVMAVSLNLTVGMLGELSLGHAGFMSVGAFAGTLVWVSLYDTTFPKPAALLLAFVVGGVVAGIFGFLVGIPVLRLSGDYLAIVTLAFGEIVKNFMNACNLGVDSKGLHFSLKDTASLNLDADGNPAVFTGEFVSAGYAIRNLTVKASNRVGGIAAATAPEKSFGLFGSLDGARFENITLENVTLEISSGTNVAVCVGAFGGRAKDTVFTGCAVRGVSAVSAAELDVSVFAAAAAFDDGSCTFEDCTFDALDTSGLQVAEGKLTVNG